ncbi:MAG: heme-binding domain-containing protein, partial [Bacteroidetes bacterium]|nr:heme-binding domain-containing protein [Bacteroidota bacterium]
MLKKILFLLIMAFAVIQFFHPAKNKAEGEQPNNISKTVPVPGNVKDILSKACMDCHSNNTVYPWYNNIQPVAWWLNHHVKEGKGEINFDEFASYNLHRQYHKLDEIIKQVKEGEMPIASYTWVHRDARLSEEEKTSLIQWAERT